MSTNLYAQANPDAILGIWFNEEKDAKIKVYKENGKFFGKIVWHKTGEDISPYDENNPPNSGHNLPKKTTCNT